MKNILSIPLASLPGITRAFFHHFGTMTHLPGIRNFSVAMSKIGNFLVLLALLSNKKHIIYLSEFSYSVNLYNNHYCMMYYLRLCNVEYSTVLSQLLP